MGGRRLLLRSSRKTAGGTSIDLVSWVLAGSGEQSKGVMCLPLDLAYWLGRADVASRTLWAENTNKHEIIASAWRHVDFAIW